MASFSIECTTCRARLKVRDESAIGQILTCPKCSSMVLVEKPVEHPSDESSSSDAIAVGEPSTDPPPPDESTEGELESAAGELRGAAVVEPPTSPPATLPATATATPSPKPAAPGNAPPTVSGEPPAEPAATDEPVGPLSDTVEDLSVYGTQQPPPPGQLPLPEIPASVLSQQPLLPTDEWASESSQRVRSWLMLGGAATVGIIVAVGVLALVAMRMSRPDEGAIAGGTDPQLGTVATNDPGKSSGTDAVAPPGGPDSPNIPNPATSNPATSNPADPATSDPVTSDPSSSDPATSDPLVEDPGGGDPSPPGGVTPPDNGTSIATPLPDEDHPPGFVARPAGEDLPPGFVASDDASVAPDSTLDKTLHIFEGLLDKPPPADDVAAPTTIPDLVVEAPGPKRPPPRDIDLAERLGDTFAEIKFDGTSLNDFLRFMASLSTIPITLDPDAIVWLGVTPQAPVSAHEKATTVERLVQAVVQSVGLTTQVVGDQLLVTLAEQGMHEKVYEVTDLADSSEKLQALAGLLPALIAPDLWQGSGGLGNIEATATGLTIQQTSVGHRDVVELLEKLRVARGLPPSDEFPAARFDLPSRSARARKQLEKKITLNFFQPAPLDQVVDRLAEFSGCSILIDWQALHRAGWNSDTTVTMTVTDTALATTLEQLLEPMGLGYRCVNADLLQITTIERLRGRPEFEIYPIRDLLKGGESAAIMDKLQKTMGPAWFVERGGAGRWEFDAASGAILAAFPQLGQRALEASLAELRAKPPPK